MKNTKIKIIDSTLREGEQAPGVVFRDEIREKLITLLLRVGVDEIELGVASPLNSYLVNLSKQAKQAKLAAGGTDCRFSLWSRCIREDIFFAAGCKPDIISLSIPSSELHIRGRLGKSKNWIMETLASSIRYCLKLGVSKVSVGLEDASRAEPEFLQILGRIAERNGAFRVRLADTVGICTPADIGKLLKVIREAVAIETGVHCHNDFGMATANSITALEYGADWVDATVLGLGERAGNCRLEEIIGFMALHQRADRYYPERLTELCSFVAKTAGINISPYHPIVGENIFTCETGLHQHGIIKKQEAYEPYRPDLVGKKHNLLFGRKTGWGAVKMELEKTGIELTNGQVRAFMETVRKNKKGLSVRELQQLVTGIN